MRTKAIVIRKNLVNEYDQMVTLYSEDFGTMRAMARGICRPTSVQSLHVQALNLIEFEIIHGRATPIISSAHGIDQFDVVKNSLPRLAAAQFFTEVLDKIAFENERDPKLWDFLTAMLADFNQCADREVFGKFRAHQAKFLEVLGYAPQVSHCVVCSRDALSGPEKMVALSPELGGVMCGDCFLASGRGILFDKADLALLSGAETGEAFTVRHSALDTFFEYTVGRQLTSLAFLYQVINPALEH